MASVLIGYIPSSHGEKELVATDKDKGIVSSAADRVREITVALRGKNPWHSANSDVYHNNRNCQAGNSIAPENVQQGTSGKPLCGSSNGSTARVVR